MVVGSDYWLMFAVAGGDVETRDIEDTAAIRDNCNAAHHSRFCLLSSSQG